jgi:hypothetical protein
MNPFVEDNSEALKSEAWYHDTIKRLNPKLREILEANGVPPAKALEHVQKVVSAQLNLFGAIGCKLVLMVS